MNKNLYLFDFDGTITKKNSFFHFLIHTFSLWEILLKLTINGPKLIFILTHEGLSKLKENILSIFFKGKLKNEIEELGHVYSKKYIDSIIRSHFITYLEKIDRNNSDIYIVSASLDFWLQDYANKNCLKLISTELLYKDDVFTGQFNGNNCKGVEKVNRIKKEINLNKYSSIIAFGDSSGDKEMLNLANKSFFKPFVGSCNLMSY